MGAMIHFGTDGWRARLDGDFTEESVARIADAAARYWRDAPCGTVYVGYDTRSESEHFARLAAEVLAGRGLDAVLGGGPVPTPALSWSVANDPDACGALMITGSHHPQDYLGVKLRVADGGGGTSDFYDELEELIDPDAPRERGPVRTADLMTAYRQRLIQTVDAKAISAAGLKVVVDPMYGAARGQLARVLTALGVETVEIHDAEEPEWDELRPEPVEPWVDDCECAVVKQGACMGLVTDGDADRVGAIDERGRFINPHTIIALLLKHLVQNRGLTGRVVLSLSASVLPRRVAKSLGCRVTMRPIGFKHIYEEMARGDVLMGGEEAGGIGMPFHLHERDGLLCCLMLCELVAMTGKSLGSLVDELQAEYGSLSYGRRDLRLEPEVIESLRTMLPGVNPQKIAGRKPCSVSRLDGLRFEFEDESWLLLRPSGTEPLVRVYAEAESVETRDALLDAGCDIARGDF